MLPQTDRWPGGGWGTAGRGAAQPVPVPAHPRPVLACVYPPRVHHEGPVPAHTVPTRHEGNYTAWITYCQLAFDIQTVDV